MEYYLKNECSCGGDVLLMTFAEEDKETHKKMVLISHGVCVYCDKNHVMPNEELFVFLGTLNRNAYYKAWNFTFMSKHKFKVEYLDAHHIKFNDVILTNRKTPGSRIIFKTDQYVIKFDFCEYEPFKQCKKERENYAKIRKSKWKDYFVPVLQYGESHGVCYIVQPRIKLSRGRKPNWPLDTLLEIENDLGIDDLSCNTSNWTIIDGKILIFDYGIWILVVDK